MRILITGASGAVGAALAHSLAGSHELRGLSRDPARVAPELAIEMVRGDALSGAGLAPALSGIEVCYYLIHSMEPSAVGRFEQRDRLAAERFGAAASAAGVRRIVYLGGLIPATGASSPHLRSRGEVEQILLEAVPDSVALRASLVIGARSRSFRAIVALIERLPVVPLPPWRRFRTQPIDERDAIAYLVAAAQAPGAGGRSFDIAGPEVVSYGAMIERIAELMLLDRPLLALPGAPATLSSVLAARVSGQPSELLGPLMGSLNCDLLAADEPARATFGVPLHSFDAAVEHALREMEALERAGSR
jgi:uncharacterized protein YbjT (DUF2867 family)